MSAQGSAQQFSGSALRHLREQAGIARRHVAYAVNRTENMVYLYEVGRSMPPDDVLYRLAEFFECDVADLFEEVEA